MDLNWFVDNVASSLTDNIRVSVGQGRGLEEQAGVVRCSINVVVE